MVACDVEDPKLADEPGRIAALERYQVLDTPREPAFEKITALVQQVFGAPYCTISLIDRERQWFKSTQGIDASETARDVAFCDHAIRARETMVVEDAQTDARFADNPFVTGDPNIRSYAGVPLSSPDGYNLGTLCVSDTKPRAFSEPQLAILRNFAGLVMDELELRTIAHKDFLTGAATRRAFVDAATRCIERFERKGRPGALVILDIDHFKSINDRFGHPFGDSVLKGVTGACEQLLRATDVLGRLGGEEFGVLLCDTERDEAIAIAERLRAQIAGVEFDAHPGLTVTASFGVAALVGGEDPAAWLAAADDALYEAKRGGRNRTIAA